MLQFVFISVTINYDQMLLLSYNYRLYVDLVLYFVRCCHETSFTLHWHCNLFRCVLYRSQISNYISYQFLRNYNFLLAANLNNKNTQLLLKNKNTQLLAIFIIRDLCNYFYQLVLTQYLSYFCKSMSWNQYLIILGNIEQLFYDLWFRKTW